MKKLVLISVVLTSLAISISGCGKSEGSVGEKICNGNSDEVLGGYAGTQKVFIGPVDLVALNVMNPVSEDLVCTISQDNKLLLSFDYFGFTMSGNMNNVKNNVLTLDSLILDGKAADFSTDGNLPGLLGDVELYDLRAGGTVTFNCNGTITTDFRVKRCSTNIVNPLDTFQNLQILDGLGVRLVGTFTKN